MTSLSRYIIAVRQLYINSELNEWEAIVVKEFRTIKSIYNVELESKIIDNNSEVLVVILPGIGYTLDRPLLDYSKKLCMELGYDVLPIEYGFQAARVQFNSERFNNLLDESMEILKISLSSKYKKIVFIGKSIGTVVQKILQKRLKDENDSYHFENIYLTPVDKTVDLGIEAGSLVFTGSCDPLISKGNVHKLEKIEGLKLIKITDADHSLNIKNDVVKSTEYLMNIIKKEKDYLLMKI